MPAGNFRKVLTNQILYFFSTVTLRNVMPPRKEEGAQAEAKSVYLCSISQYTWGLLMM